MTAKLTGILTDVFPVETFPNGFVKKIFWLKQPDRERYPQHWSIELHNEDTKQLNRVAIGDRLEVEVEIRGRKYFKRDRSEGIVVSLVCVGMRILDKLDTAPNAAGNYVQKVKPGRESDADRQGPQGTLL